MSDIHINITLIIGIILLITGIKAGFKTGLTKGLSHLVAMIITVISLALILMLLKSLHAEHTRNVLLSVIALVILGTVYGMVKFLLKSAHKVSELPILHLADSLGGVLIGVLWVFIIYMTMITLACRGWLHSFGEMVVADVNSSKILTYINSYNIFVK